MRSTGAGRTTYADYKHIDSRNWAEVIDEPEEKIVVFELSPH
jgi:hypothetical protein